MTVDFTALWMPEAHTFWNDHKALRKHLEKMEGELDSIVSSGLPVGNFEEELDYAITCVRERLGEIEPKPQVKAPRQAQVKVSSQRPVKVQVRKNGSLLGTLVKLFIIVAIGAIAFSLIAKVLPYIIILIFIKGVFMRPERKMR